MPVESFLTDVKSVDKAKEQLKCCVAERNSALLVQYNLRQIFCKDAFLKSSQPLLRKTEKYA